jgi:hypothetical protein
LIANNLDYLQEYDYKLVIINDNEISANLPIIRSHRDFEIILFDYRTFFNLVVLDEFCTNRWDRKKNFIFLFRNLNWQEIVLRFKLLGIIVSGGSKNKRHILSSLGIRLGLFMKAVTGLDLRNKVKRSYYLTQKESLTNTQTHYDILNLDWKKDKDINDLLDKSHYSEEKKKIEWIILHYLY